MIQGVLFDMDGVLLDTERLGNTGWQLAAEQLGLPVTDAFVASLRGGNVNDTRALYEKTFHRTDFDEARAIRVNYSNDYIRRNGVPEKPGVHELLEYLRARNIPMALASGTARKAVMHHLEAIGVKEYFSAFVCGDDVPRAKPDPEIFLRAAAALGLPAEQCMVIEDSVNGITAARRAGCYTVMVPDLTPSSPELAEIYDICVPSLTDVIPVVARQCPREAV